MRVKNSHHLPAKLLDVRPAVSAVVATAAVLLASCGQVDTSSGPDSGSSKIPVYNGQSADGVATELLQRNAADATGTSLSTTMNSVLQTINSSAAVNSAFSLPVIGLGQQSTNEGAFNDPTEPGPLLNDDFDKRVRDESQSLFGTTLGLTNSSTATRTGNTINIDPDENEICAQDASVGVLDQANCVQLLADLTVRLDATTDKSGLITYFFRNQPVVEIGYSPVFGSYELKLAGMHSVLKRVSELDSQVTDVADTMAGSLRFQAVVTNQAAGSEAGSISLSIPEALSIKNLAKGTNISIAPSTLMEMTADSSTGSASLELNIGALSFASINDELEGNPLQKLVMAGLTARADLTRNGNVLTMSNVGLGNGPMVLTIDSIEAMRASMKTLGFTVNEESNSFTLVGDLDFNVMMNNVLGNANPFESHDASETFSISAASGTTFSELVSGVMRVEKGGPLSVQYAITDGVSSENGTVTVQQGQCFGENYSTDIPIEVTGC